MLQIIVTKSFNNPNLPVSQIGSVMNLSSSIATYEMIDGYDYSEKGHHLNTVGLTFDSMGLVGTGLDGAYADTGLLEPDAYTVIVAFNAQIPPQTTQLWTTLGTATTPYNGARQAVQTGKGLNSQAFAGDGTTGAAANLVSGAVTDMWEIYGFALNNTNMRTYRGSSNAFVEAAVVNNRRKSSYTMRIAGGYLAPHNLGIIGHVGVFAVYNGVLTDAQIQEQVAKAKQLMKDRGATFSW